MRKMQKINQRFKKVDNLCESIVYAKFTKQFDALFDSKEIITSEEKFESIYVEDKEFETELKRFRALITFCVGDTGIGKTTSLRHCFKLRIGRENHADFVEKELIFAVFFNDIRTSDKMESHICARIASMCTKLEEEYPDLKARLKTDQGKEEFYKFMRQYEASTVLEYINPVEAMDMDERELIRMRLNEAYNKNPLEFQASILKYYIAKKCDKYERLIIILDDIEMFSEEYQEMIIGQFINLQKFMQKTDYTRNPRYRVNLIISIQPNMYHVLNNKGICSLSETAIFKKPMDLNAVFKKRFDYYSTENYYDISNNENYNFLMDMVKDFDETYKDLILHLCFFNIRKAVAYMARIFANNFWMQGGIEQEHNSDTKAFNYSFNNISVLRALGCNENQVFHGNSNSIMPNIFYTTREEDLSINCLLVLKYFYKKREDSQYGGYAEKLEVAKEIWKAIFGKEKAKFVKAANYLYEKKALRKLIKNSNDDKDYIDDKSYLYISSLGIELFEMFGRDSVLLEMLRETAWRDFENREAFSDQSSSELMGKAEQISIFRDLLEYINYLREKEEDILAISKERRTSGRYKKAFGASLAVQLLLDGVEKSLKYSEVMNKEDMSDRFVAVQKRINESKKKINME